MLAKQHDLQKYQIQWGQRYPHVMLRAKLSSSCILVKSVCSICPCSGEIVFRCNNHENFKLLLHAEVGDKQASENQAQKAYPLPRFFIRVQSGKFNPICLRTIRAYSAPTMYPELPANTGEISFMQTHADSTDYSQHAPLLRSWCKSRFLQILYNLRLMQMLQGEKYTLGIHRQRPNTNIRLKRRVWSALSRSLTSDFALSCCPCTVSLVASRPVLAINRGRRRKHGLYFP